MRTSIFGLCISALLAIGCAGTTPGAKTHDMSEVVEKARSFDETDVTLCSRGR